MSVHMPSRNKQSVKSLSLSFKGWLHQILEQNKVFNWLVDFVRNFWYLSTLYQAWKFKQIWTWFSLFASRCLSKKINEYILVYEAIKWIHCQSCKYWRWCYWFFLRISLQECYQQCKNEPLQQLKTEPVYKNILLLNPDVWNDCINWLHWSCVRFIRLIFQS